jgi:hypothetical protein
MRSGLSFRLETGNDVITATSSAGRTDARQPAGTRSV